MWSGMKNHKEFGLAKHLLSQLTLKVLTVSMQFKTARPPSALLLDNTAFLSLWGLFSQIKSRNNLLMTLAVESLTKRESDG